jgi:hypothetical protein
MGGFGSGNRKPRNRKWTVEESLPLGIRDLRKRIYADSAGTLTWTWASGEKSAIGYVVIWDAGGPTVALHYRCRDEEDILFPLRLQKTPTNFNGERWWLTCPLIVGGVACGRRVGTVFLPPGARYFGCRTCHGLTYRSCQEAHQDERWDRDPDRLDRWVDTMKRRMGAR